MIKLPTRNPMRTSHLENSFLVQRRGMALLAALLPVAFLVSSFVFNRTDFQTSISAYYWTLDLERNFFVGVLCSIGVFLLLYKGYNWLEDRILDLAGVSAVGVAFFPMDQTGDCASAGISAHGVFAATFFACIFFICIFMSKNSLEDVHDVRRRASYRLAYRVCSGIMIANIALAVLSRFLPKEYTRMLCENSMIFLFEAIGVWAFSAFWYIKTRELDPSRSWMPFGKRHEA
jgi:hypothetical protein